MGEDMLIFSALVEGVFKLTLALAGFIMARLALLWMDRALVTKEFSTWLEKANDQARAIYYAGRIIAIGLLVGLALS